VDPFIWVTQSNTGIVMMEIYVDKFQTIGSDESIKEVIEDFKKHGFGLKIKEILKYYLICHIKTNKKDGIARI
jgi:hypothetical protein